MLFVSRDISEVFVENHRDLSNRQFNFAHRDHIKDNCFEKCKSYMYNNMR